RGAAVARPRRRPARRRPPGGAAAPLRRRAPPRSPRAPEPSADRRPGGASAPPARRPGARGARGPAGRHRTESGVMADDVVGLVDGSLPSTTRRFTVALEEGAHLQLDELVVVEQQLEDGAPLAH